MTNHSNTSNAQGRVFKEAFNSLLGQGKEIPFNPEWENGTGYLDYIVDGDDAPILAPGEMAISRMPNGRRIIIVGTRFGNAAVFDRYTNQDGGGVYVTNRPRGIIFRELLPEGSVGVTTMIRFVGSWSNFADNIGAMLEKYAEDFSA